MYSQPGSSWQRGNHASLILLGELILLLLLLVLLVMLVVVVVLLLLLVLLLQLPTPLPSTLLLSPPWTPSPLLPLAATITLLIPAVSV
jgi:hypothetical protein